MKSTLRYIGGPEMPRSKSRAVVRSRGSSGSSRCPTPGGATLAPASRSLRRAATREPRFMLIAVCHWGSTWSSTKHTETSTSGAARPSSLGHGVDQEAGRDGEHRRQHGRAARGRSTRSAPAAGRPRGRTAKNRYGSALRRAAARVSPRPGAVRRTSGRAARTRSRPRAGPASPPRATASRNCSRVNHRAASISAPSTSISRDSAWATKPSIRLAGSGHGWLPK